MGLAMNYDGDSVKSWAGDSRWRACRADFARFRAHGYSGWGSEGFWALAVFRLQKALQTRGPKWLFAPLRTGLNLVRKLVKMITNIEIDVDAEIGPGTLIPHLGPIHIQAGTKIGADCSIYHSCTIGAGLRPGAATIGDHVYISCGASIIGKVNIGDKAVIGANSVIITDIPAGHTAVGVPARSFGASRNYQPP